MGLSWIERQGVRIAWRRMEAKMGALKTWSPLIGSAVLVATVLLRSFGQTEVADTLEGVGSATGLATMSMVTPAEAAAIATTFGLVLKGLSLYRKARAEKG